jgi:hypothetical protein
MKEKDRFSLRPMNKDEAYVDLIKLLKALPNIPLSNQNLSEIVYELKKKYNVTTKKWTLKKD